MSADNLLASSPELALPNQELSNAFGAGPVIAQLDVSISNEVVHLLSEQLYTSPLKAIEEIVVNAYDADATECRIGLLLGDATQDGSNNILDPVYTTAVQMKT